MQRHLTTGSTLITALMAAYAVSDREVSVCSAQDGHSASLHDLADIMRSRAALTRRPAQSRHREGRPALESLAPPDVGGR